MKTKSNMTVKQKPKELDKDEKLFMKTIKKSGIYKLKDGIMIVEKVKSKELDWEKEWNKLTVKSYNLKTEKYENEPIIFVNDKSWKKVKNFIQSLLTQQRTELECEDCSPEDKHICPTDRSTTRISRPCAGEDIQTIAGTLLKSKEWKEWYKYASENMLFDVGETETVDMMSDGHFNSFIEFTKSKVRTELLEEIPKKIKGKNKEFVEGYNNCLDDISNLLKKL